MSPTASVPWTFPPPGSDAGDVIIPSALLVSYENYFLNPPSIIYQGVRQELPGGLRYIQASLSLVELLHYCALIGRELRQLSYAIKNQLKATKTRGFRTKYPPFLNFHAEKKSIKVAYNRLKGRSVVNRT